jgi:cold shock CspA family protein
MRGVVRWYSHQGYGFVDPVPSADGKALYFHICDVPSRTVFKAGDAVTFDVVQAPKGPKCVNVRATKTKEAIQCPQTL